MNGGFARFARGGAGNPAARTVSIQGNGSLRISPNLLEEIGSPTHLALLFDGDGSRIALEPTTGDDPNGYPVRLQRATHLVSASAFLRHIGREPEGCKGAYPATVEGGLIVVPIPANEADQ